MRPHLLFPACLLALGALAAPAHAIGYRLQDISGGGVFSGASVINNAGQVVGTGRPGESGYEAYLYDPVAGLIPLAAGLPAGATGSQGLALNDAGQVAGLWSLGSDGVARGFAYDPRTGLRDLGRAGAAPAHIDPDGRITGRLEDAAGNGVPFIDVPGVGMVLQSTPVTVTSVVGLQAGDRIVANRQQPDNRENTRAGVLSYGTWRDLSMPANRTSTYAQGFNDAGDIVGTVSSPYDHGMITQYRASAWRADGRLVDIAAALDNPFMSFAQAVNEQGDVVGSGARAPESGSFSFLHNLQTGVSHDLDTLLDPSTTVGWTAITPTDINDRGQIVGYGLFDGGYRALLLTPYAPVPEPGSTALMLSGLALVAGVARVRRPPGLRRSAARR